jgi:hypothetical protein
VELNNSRIKDKSKANSPKNATPGSPFEKIIKNSNIKK